MADNPLSTTGKVCGECHDGDLQVEHAKSTSTSAAGGCVSCHPAPRNTLTPWSKETCVQSGCHAAASGAAMHGAESSDHTPAPANAACAECHDGNLEALHAAASATVGGQVRTSCSVCHAAGVPSSRDCTSCHHDDGVDYHADKTTAHTMLSATVTSCISAGCHDADATTVLEGKSLDEIHEDASTTVGEETRESCQICHAQGVTPVADCTTAGCHADRALPHGYDAELHTAAPPAGVTISGTSFDVACSTCHGLELGPVHTTATCSTCHATLVSNLATDGGWDDGCAQANCHAGTSTVPMHAGIDASHETVAGEGCYAASCHPASESLAETHRNASAVLGGETRTSRQVCHWNGTPASGACTSCHNAETYSDPNHYDEAKHAALDHESSGFLFCSDCHSMSLAAEHEVVKAQGDEAADGNVSCTECHNDDYGMQVVNAQWELSENQEEWHACGDCHSEAGLGDRHMERSSAHEALENPSCDGSVCHGGVPSSQIEQLHGYTTEDGEGRTFCLVCHTDGADTDLAGASCGEDGTCHTDKADGNHGYAAVNHTATPTSGVTISGTSFDVACSSCHGLELGPVHTTATCSTCHAVLVDELDADGGWDDGCAQANCHAGTSAVPMHADVNSSARDAPGERHGLHLVRLSRLSGNDRP